MTQTQVSKASFDKNTLQALTSLQPKQNSLTPRHKQFNLGSLDLTKVKSALPSSTKNSESPIRVIRGSLTARNGDKIELVDALVTPKQSLGGYGNSNKISFSPVRAYKKIKLKPLLPKFNFNMPGTTKESSPQDSKEESRRTSGILQSSSSAKVLLNYEELTLLNPIKRKSFVLKTEQITDSATPLSARLPTITLRTMEDSLKDSLKPSDFDAVKVLFSDEDSSDAEEKKKKKKPVTPEYQTLTVTRTPKKRLSEGSGESSEISNLLMKHPSNDKNDKKNIMHFGAIKTPKTFYFPVGDPIDLNERFRNTFSLRTPKKLLKKQGNPPQHVVESLQNSFEKDNIQPQEEQKRGIEHTFSPVLTHVKSPAQQREAKRSPSPNSPNSPKSPKSPLVSNHEQTGTTKEISLDPNESFGKKSSFDNQNSPTAEKTLTLNLKTSEDWSNFVGIHKKSVTFTDSGSNGSGSPANSESHSASPALKSSLKKAALEGKVVKLSGFAGETKPSDTLEPLELSRKNTPPTTQSEEKEPEDPLNVFKSNKNNVNFFEFNEENLFMSKRRHSNVNDIILRSKPMRLQSEVKEENPGAPVIISYPGEPGSITIQPKFMEGYGSMCFTELWSEKSKSQYKYLKKEEIGMLKKVYAAAEDAVYRSERAAKKHAVEQRMFANRMESLSPTRRNTEMQRQSLSPRRRPSFTFETQAVSPSIRGVIDAPVKSTKSRKLSLFLPSY